MKYVIFTLLTLLAISGLAVLFLLNSFIRDVYDSGNLIAMCIYIPFVFALNLIALLAIKEEIFE
jgi:hypothetical protein